MLLSAMRRDFIRFDLIEFLWFKTLLPSKVADKVPIHLPPQSHTLHIPSPPQLCGERERFACSFYVLIKKCRLVRVSI